MSPSGTNLQVLVLSAAGADLLLPAGAVAEIVRAEDLEPTPTLGFDWVSGTLPWRGQSVPVVRLADSLAPDDRSHIVVVCLAPSGNPALPYLAILSPGLPHLERVIAERLAPDDGAPQAVPWYALTGLKFNGSPAWLLNLAALEQSLLAGSA